MKIIIVSNYYFPEIGAAPNRITSLAEGFTNNGIQVEIVCPLPNYPEGKVYEGYRHKLRKTENQGSSKVFRYWIYPSVSKNAVKRILSMVSFALSLWLYLFSRNRIRKADWVIVQSPPLLVAFSAIILFKLLLKRKVALNVSDIWPLTAYDLGVLSKGRFYRFLERIERFNYKHCDLIIGQTEGILDHIQSIISKRSFLYRNIQRIERVPELRTEKTEFAFKIVYAGLLGVAQGVYNMISEIDFASIDVEFDIYGHGNEKEKIEAFIHDHPNKGISYKGLVSRQELHSILPRYDAAIVPLAAQIKSAAPSKLFELAHLGVPILYCGEGEGAQIVEKYDLGITSPTSDPDKLKQAIQTMVNLPEKEYQQLKENCLRVSQKHFNFESQMKNLITVLSNEE